MVESKQLPPNRRKTANNNNSHSSIGPDSFTSGKKELYWLGNHSLLQDEETGLPTERLDPTALAWIAERASPEVAARVATASEAAKYI